MSVLKGLKELIRGMTITGKHLGRHAVTIQYPEERWEMPERSRGIVVLLSDQETGELNCTACELCMRACPTAAIIIDAPRGEDKKKVIQRFDIDFGLCCFCGLCEEACNFSAIKLAPKYEFSTLGKDELVWDLNKLQEMGRDVAYEDTRKKKNPAPINLITDRTPEERRREAEEATRKAREEAARAAAEAAANPEPKEEQTEDSGEEKSDG
jgi:NADH-quinone oxidoreductase subunit I